MLNRDTVAAAHIDDPKENVCVQNLNERVHIMDSNRYEESKKYKQRRAMFAETPWQARFQGLGGTFGSPSGGVGKGNAPAPWDHCIPNPRDAVVWWWERNVVQLIQIEGLPCERSCSQRTGNPRQGYTSSHGSEPAGDIPGESEPYI